MDRLFADKPQMAFAWALLVCLIGWPLSLFWWAAEEPPFVLSLSWLALVLTSLDIIKTTYVTRKVGEKDKE